MIAAAKSRAHSSWQSASGWLADVGHAWSRFWFQPRLPHTLAVLRIITGLMLLYSHLVLASDLSSFVGDNAWINNETAMHLHDGAFGFSDWGRSYLWYLGNPLILWMHHALTLVVTACFAVGLLTRFTAPMAWFLQVMYVHRLTGTLFGLDQIVTYSAMYLMFAPCGSLFSVDAWLRSQFSETHGGKRWFRWLLPSKQPSVSANIATRLMQIHLCTIYFFGGVAKARGTSWWDGTAMWYSAGNYEYQSLDLTWIANFPRLSSAMTNLTLFWELSYAALIWPKLTRPIVIGLAIVMHGGIALFLGMITFGVMMIAANFIFIPPALLAGRTKQADNTDERSTDDPNEEIAIETPSIDDQRSQEARLDELGDLEDIELDIAPESSVDLIGSSLSGLSSSNLSSLSGIGVDELDRKEQSINRREKRVKEASDKINARAKKLKSREEKYRERVEKLKDREAKIKGLVDRAKDRKKK